MINFAVQGTIDNEKISKNENLGVEEIKVNFCYLFLFYNFLRKIS